AGARCTQRPDDRKSPWNLLVDTSAPYEPSLTPPAPASCYSRPTGSPDQSAVADEGRGYADEGEEVLGLAFVAQGVIADTVIDLIGTIGNAVLGTPMPAR
ncbi:hypothetical protein ACFU9X_42965, partial [Streptomyces atratus]|uniref:hypothetical protein n=1 Tax=Streptomyces atratus TaxID=1893 RepID=UPI0036C6A24C